MWVTLLLVLHLLYPGHEAKIRMDEAARVLCALAEAARIFHAREVAPLQPRPCAGCLLCRLLSCRMCLHQFVCP